MTVVIISMLICVIVAIFAIAIVLSAGEEAPWMRQLLGERTTHVLQDWGRRGAGDALILDEFEGAQPASEAHTVIDLDAAEHITEQPARFDTADDLLRDDRLVPNIATTTADSLPVRKLAALPPVGRSLFFDNAPPAEGPYVGRPKHRRYLGAGIGAPTSSERIAEELPAARHAS